MKAKLSIAILLLLTIESFSQISFEPGYFINNSNQRTDCLIKNQDWKNNPTELEYKITEKSEVENININQIKEFSINDVSKFIRATVAIDRSSKLVSHMSMKKEPIFKEEQLFLKVVLEGKATLFKYKDNNLERFFYQVNNSEIEQLVYKKYKTSDSNGFIRENDSFKQQLFNNLKCKDISVKSIRTLRYSNNDLRNFFIRYNQCSNSKYANYENKQKRDLFNINIRPGINNSSLDIRGLNQVGRNADFGSKLGLRFGVEFEYILPFNKNKWSLFLEPTYRKFESEKEILGIPTPTVPFDDRVTINYTSIEFPVGIRHYMFLNSSSKLFVNAALIFDRSKSKFNFERLSVLEVRSDNSLSFGFGYKYLDKYSLEFRYATPRDLLSLNSGWSSEYKNISLIIGYTLF